MGYDLHRFQGEVDEELTCPICSGVLEEPLQAAMCEHAFCRVCINEWLSRQPSCPVDRNALTTANLRAVPRILRNLLSRLSITCENVAYGCNLVLKLDALNSHLEECEHNPKRPLPCEKGCGFVIPKDELKDHNCVRELRTLIHTQQQKMAEFKTDITDQNLTINELKRELQLFKDFMRAMRVSNPAMRAIADQMERDEVIRWSSTLARARVTRWGGMISTPDDALQMMIKRALSESGCPPHILDNLMENCHERRWPRGLSSLETRQNNRRIYDNYICRRIPENIHPYHGIRRGELFAEKNILVSSNPQIEQLFIMSYRIIKLGLVVVGMNSLSKRNIYEDFSVVIGKQAVLVLSCDNTHMSEDVMVDPGLVMIFAHGIE